jgi:predicted DNA-binding antitoxin AbrB/MazE fold protein
LDVTDETWRKEFALMTQVVKAIFENGVLRPVEALALPEHQRVQVTVEAISETGNGGETPSVRRDPLEGLRVATGIRDLSEHFDDYRFGRRTP